MKAVLLAAGEGTRLRPLTLTTPKCLVPINEKPLIDFWLDMLVPNNQIEEIYINVCYLKELIISHIEKNWTNTNKIKIWHEESLMGTAGTLKYHYDDLENHDVLVVHADNLSVFSFESFAQSYYDRQSRQLMSMMLFEADNPSQCGIVELDSDSNVIAMHEKVSNPPGNLANGAVYIFSTQIIDWISQNNVSDISTEVIPEFLGKILAWKNSEYHRDIGTPESYGTAQKDFS